MTHLLRSVVAFRDFENFVVEWNIDGGPFGADIATCDPTFSM